jgi:hypothetical protein
MLLLMTELVGVPKITLGGQNDDEIIGNLVSYIGFGLVVVVGLYIFMRLYLPAALDRKMAKQEALKARQAVLDQPR